METVIHKAGLSFRKSAGIALAMALSVAGVQTLRAATTYNGVEMTPEQIASAISSLAAQIRQEILRLPATSSVEEYEASILFVADQSGQPEVVICSAFDTVKAEAATPDNARVAMDNVCRILKRRRGTGAIPGGQGDFTPPPFAPPGLAPGGGSNYSQ
ncbi:MAG TPA: hypothetical protein VF463_07245 [Sphingobium sp.]